MKVPKVPKVPKPSYDTRGAKSATPFRGHMAPDTCGTTEGARGYGTSPTAEAIACQDPQPDAGSPCSCEICQPDLDSDMQCPTHKNSI